MAVRKLRGVRVLPLRPEQEDEPLARGRFKELRGLSQGRLREQIYAAAQAKFHDSVQERRHFHKHGSALGTRSLEAYLALAESIQQHPSRVFSGYHRRLRRPAIVQWVFVRGNVIASVGAFVGGMVLTSLFPVRIGETRATLERVLTETENGRGLVEVQLE